MSVDLKLKRQIEIKDNDVKSIYDFEDAVSSDEFLKPFLQKGADNRLKSIVATIQAELNSIICKMGRYPRYNWRYKNTISKQMLSYFYGNYGRSKQGSRKTRSNESKQCC